MPDHRRPEPWATDPWCVRGSSYTERRGVRRHHEGEAGRGQQRRHSRFQPGTEQLRCAVGGCRPAQATQGRRDPGLGARREAPEDLRGRGPGSSRAASPRGSSGATAPPPSPPRNSSCRRQQQQQQPQEQLQRARERPQQQQVQPRVAPVPQPRGQQQQEQARVAPASQLQEQQQQQQQLQEKRPGLRGRWVPGTSGLVLSCFLPLRRCSAFFLKASPLCYQGSSPQRFLYHCRLIGWWPGGRGLGVDSNGDSGCGTLRYSDLCQPSGV